MTKTFKSPNNCWHKSFNHEYGLQFQDLKIRMHTSILQAPIIKVLIFDCFLGILEFSFKFCPNPIQLNDSDSCDDVKLCIELVQTKIQLFHLIVFQK